MKKYELVKNIIRERILSNMYPKGSILPDQKVLSASFDVSSITLKKALDDLAREGFILKKSGFGTVVIGPSTLINSVDAPADNFDGLSKQEGRDRITSHVIKFEVVFPQKEVQTHLNISAEEPTYHIIRLRLLDGNPFILEDTYMPVKLVPGLSKSVLETSIYSYIKNTLGLNMSGMSRKIQARQATELDINYLNVVEQTPILEVEQIVWLVNGHAIEYSKSRNEFNKRSYFVFESN